MKTLIILILCISNITFASFDVNFNTFSKWLEDSEPSIEHKAQDCCDHEAKELMNKCARDLCGDSRGKNSTSLYVDNEKVKRINENSNALKEFEEKKPDIEKYISGTRENYRKFFENDFFQKPIDIDKIIDSLSDDALVSEIMFNLSYPEVMVNIRNDGSFEMELFFYEFKDLVLSEEEQKEIEKWKKKHEAYVRNNITEQAELEIITLENFKNRLTQAVNLLKKAINESSLSEENKKSNLSMLKEDIEDKISNNNISGYESYNYMYTINNVNDSVGSDHKVDLTSILPEVEKDYEISIPVGRSLLKKVYKKKVASNLLSKVKEFYSDDRNWNNVLGKCRNMWTFKAYEDGLENEILKYKKNLKKKIDLLKARSLSKLSEISRDTIVKELDIVKIEYEKGFDDYIEYFLSSLEEEIEPLDGKYSTDLEKLNLLKRLNSSNAYSDEESFYPSELDDCSDVLSIGGDFFSSELSLKNTQISYSEFSTLHPAQGIGIFNHELGHFISHRLSRGHYSKDSYETFMKLRACVNSKYKDTEGLIIANKNFSGDNLYSEEDTADIFLYDLSDQSHRYVSCNLIEPAKNGVDYEELYLLNYEKLDTHSSPLLRTIREAIHNHKILPPSCMKLTEKYKDRLDFEPCYFE